MHNCDVLFVINFEGKPIRRRVKREVRGGKNDQNKDCWIPLESATYENNYRRELLYTCL